MYLFDENTSERIVLFMRDLGDTEVLHLSEVFQRGTLDPDLIPQVAAYGYVLVTNDQAMRKEHRALLNQHSVAALFLPPKYADLGRWKQAEFLIRYWPYIRKQAELNPWLGLMRIDNTGNLLTLETNFQYGYR